MLFYWQITLDVFCLSSAQRTASGNPNMSLLNVHHTHNTIWIHLAYYNSSRPYHSHTLTLFLSLSLSTFQLPCIAYVMYKCLANSIVFFFYLCPGPRFPSTSYTIQLSPSGSGINWSWSGMWNDIYNRTPNNIHKFIAIRNIWVQRTRNTERVVLLPKMPGLWALYHYIYIYIYMQP